MPNMLKDLQKNIKGHHLISALAAVFAIYLIYRFIVRTNGSKDSMQSGHLTKAQEIQARQDASGGNGVAQAADPMGENEQFAAVQGVQGQAAGLPPSCNSGASLQAGDLLPKDSNTQFQQLSPSGSGGLENVNLLKAGYHSGIDTVGSSLRNANLQVRSEPPNPTSKVSPWMNTTIEPDLMRVPLELGCGPQ
jgi:hypothetical protein